MKRTNHAWKLEKRGISILQIENLILQLISSNGGSIDAEDIRAELCDYYPPRQGLIYLDRMVQRGIMVFKFKTKTYSLPKNFQI